MPADRRAGGGAEMSAPRIRLGDRGLTLSLPAGEAYFNYFWLRDNCASSIDPGTRERVFDITLSGQDPRPEAARIAEGALVIDWQGERHRTRYGLDFLADFHARGTMPDAAAMPRRLWRSGQYARFARIAQADIDAEPGARAAFARALIEDGIALITGMEDSDAGLTRLATALGPVTPTIDGQYFDVRFEIAPTNLAFTAKALGMHTDLPCMELAPGIQFLHCRRNTVEGGRSLFLDGAAVAEAFRDSNPKDFALLSTLKVPFFRRHDQWDMRAHQQVIELDQDGAVSGLTVSHHLSDVFDLPQEVLDDYYPAFCRFLEAVRDERFLNRFRLAAGECIVFDNHRILHGREAFSADSGARHLRGCYVDRGAVRSTYRVLARDGHADVPVAAE